MSVTNDDDDDAHIVDEAFALASMATSQDVGDTVLFATPAFRRGVEQQLRASYIEQQLKMGEMLPPARRGACFTGCARLVVRMAVRVYAVRPNTDAPAYTIIDGARDPVSDAALHACAPPYTCAGVDDESVADLHWHDRTEAVARHSIVCTATSTGGGVHWCPRHQRMHVCTRSCQFTVRDQVGFATCALSGRTFGGRVDATFGQGTLIVSKKVQWQKDEEQRERREAFAVRRSAMAAVEEVVTTGTSSILHSSPVSGAEKRRRIEGNALAKKKLFSDGDEKQEADSSEQQDAHSGIYIDPDAPAEGLFGDTYQLNTFGDDIGKELVRWYTQAYAVVHLLLFSDERAEIECANRQKAVNYMRHRVQSYVMSQRKARAPVCFTLMRQIEQKAANQRRIYPELLIPLHGRCRLTAYYAMMAMEFYLQLVMVMTRIQDKLDASGKAAVDQLVDISFASVAPNVIDMLHEGLKIRGQTIIEIERTLSIFPESQTIEALGFPQKQCTEVKKVLKKCVVAAADLSEPLDSMRTTHLDIVPVMFGRESVISGFLEARRRRLNIGVSSSSSSSSSS